MAGGNGRPVTHSPVLTWRDAAPVLLNMDKMTNELFQLGQVHLHKSSDAK